MALPAPPFSAGRLIPSGADRLAEAPKVGDGQRGVVVVGLGVGGDVDLLGGGQSAVDDALVLYGHDVHLAVEQEEQVARDLHTRGHQTERPSA